MDNEQKEGWEGNHWFPPLQQNICILKIKIYIYYKMDNEQKEQKEGWEGNHWFPPDNEEKEGWEGNHWFPPKKGYIYAIEPVGNDVDIGDIYIGATVKILNHRLSSHKNRYKDYLIGKRSKLTSFDLFDKYGVENCIIRLLEEFDFENNYEKNNKEEMYINTSLCVNKRKPCYIEPRQYYQNYTHFEIL